MNKKINLHDNWDQANAALDAFEKGVQELAEKHKIQFCSVEATVLARVHQQPLKAIGPSREFLIGFMPFTRVPNAELEAELKNKHE